MRVLQAMAGARFGGAEAFFTRLVIALHKAGLDQRVVIRRHEARAAALSAAGIAPVQLRFGGPLDLSSQLAMRAQIRQYRPGIVLSWMSRAADFCPPGRGRFVHVGRMGGYYKLKYYGSCDRLVGNTPDIVDYLAGEGWPRERAHYLPNFVDAAPAAPVDRQRLSTPEGAAVVLALGRLHENKAFDVLIRALAALPGVYLWLAGDGPLAAALKALAVSAGVAPRIRFLGWLDDPAPYYAAADVLCCPSRIEPLGNVVIEGWARYRPVVAAMASGPKQLIRDGENGLLVPIDDASATAAALGRLLSDGNLAARLADCGRASYEQDFTEAKVVRKYMDFFAQVSA